MNVEQAVGLDELKAFMLRHKRVMLQFSAGKDSAACLKLLRSYIDKVLVVWCNPGYPYPETALYMQRIKHSVPHFEMVEGDQPAFTAKYGYPADSVPFESTPLGRLVSKKPGLPLVHVTECCGHNLWLRLRLAVQEHPECTGIIKGEKDADELAARPRQVHADGREYFYPLATWTDRDVLQFLTPDELPDSYRRGHPASFDCMTCTAYLGHNPGRIDELQRRHAQEWKLIEPVMRYQRLKAMEHLGHLMREYPI